MINSITIKNIENYRSLSVASLIKRKLKKDTQFFLNNNNNNNKLLYIKKKKFFEMQINIQINNSVFFNKCISYFSQKYLKMMLFY